MNKRTGATVAIIQARLGSTRLPGKMLMDLSGHPVIHWVIERVKRASKVEQVILATTDRELDDPLAEYAEKSGIIVFRGKEEDVLGRFAQAVKLVDASFVIRVCADNPFVDPDIIDYAVTAFKASEYDYMYNHIPRGKCKYPDGLGIEIFKRDILEMLNQITQSQKHREHLTSYLWDNTNRFSMSNVDCPEYWDAREQPIKLDIDTAEDLEKMQKLSTSLTINSTAAEIINAWRSLNYPAE